MSLSKEDVLHIASLARLDLTEAEVEKLQTQLSAIIDYIGQLSEVDTTGIEPTAQVTGLVNHVRQDQALPIDEPTRERLLQAFPEKDGDYIKVKAVFE
jgi:aspartyl-tRNA(Asn)/glutamyl-tRNA(Gln) amidotransferase subunit C